MWKEDDDMARIGRGSFKTFLKQTRKSSTHTLGRLSNRNAYPDHTN